MRSSLQSAANRPRRYQTRVRGASASHLRRPAPPVLMPHGMLTFAVPRESAPGETRVALIPDSIAKLVAAGHAVVVQSGAGESASHPDDAYLAAGARVAANFAATTAGAQLVVKVRAPSPEEIQALE